MKRMLEHRAMNILQGGAACGSLPLPTRVQPAALTSFMRVAGEVVLLWCVVAVFVLAVMALG
jgi:hypothetical protein